jgi:hypothetical protein
MNLIKWKQKIIIQKCIISINVHARFKNYPYYQEYWQGFISISILVIISKGIHEFNRMEPMNYNLKLYYFNSCACTLQKLPALPRLLIRFHINLKFSNNKRRYNIYKLYIIYAYRVIHCFWDENSLTSSLGT